MLPIGGNYSCYLFVSKEVAVRIRSMQDVASTVRGRRRDLGINQAELAERVGVSRKWIYEFEAGKPAAGLGLVLRVLEELGLSLELLTEDSELPARGNTVDLDAILDEHHDT